MLACLASKPNTCHYHHTSQTTVRLSTGLQSSSAFLFSELAVAFLCVFSTDVSTVWNFLEPDLWYDPSLASFKSHLKTTLFSAAYITQHGSLPSNMSISYVTLGAIYVCVVLYQYAYAVFINFSTLAIWTAKRYQMYYFNIHPMRRKRSVMTTKCKLPDSATDFILTAPIMLSISASAATMSRGPTAQKLIICYYFVPVTNRICMSVQVTSSTLLVTGIRHTQH